MANNPNNYMANQIPNQTPWYAQQTPVGNFNTSPQTTNPQGQFANQVSQFVWITNPNVVDMWPVNPGCEMTFIDSENMKVYVKRVDEYNHPLKPRRFRMIEEFDEPEQPEKAPQINMDELKGFIAGEIDRAVSNRMSNMFGFSNQAVNAKDGE